MSKADDKTIEEYARKRGKAADARARRQFHLAAKDRSSLMVSSKALVAVRIHARSNGMTVAEATQKVLAIAFREELKHAK